MGTARRAPLPIARVLPPLWHIPRALRNRAHIPPAPHRPVLVAADNRHPRTFQEAATLILATSGPPADIECPLNKRQSFAFAHSQHRGRHSGRDPDTPLVPRSPNPVIAIAHCQFIYLISSMQLYLVDPRCPCCLHIHIYDILSCDLSRTCPYAHPYTTYTYRTVHIVRHFSVHGYSL
ncbi:hypothetical protein OF83DRAFT_43667 [Amylostereum chailletii]|nr:hypothetical protein OF83DRAFT_43667 [Amylostereum chailletii]